MSSVHSLRAAERTSDTPLEFRMTSSLKGFKGASQEIRRLSFRANVPSDDGVEASGSAVEFAHSESESVRFVAQVGSSMTSLSSNDTGSFSVLMVSRPRRRNKNNTVDNIMILLYDASLRQLHENVNRRHVSANMRGSGIQEIRTLSPFSERERN